MSRAQQTDLVLETWESSACGGDLKTEGRATLHHRLKPKKLPQKDRGSVRKGNAKRSGIQGKILCRSKVREAGRTDDVKAGSRTSPATQVSL